MVGIGPAGISQRRSGRPGVAFPENVPILSLQIVYVLKHSEAVLEFYVVSCGVTDRFLGSQSQYIHNIIMNNNHSML